MTPGVARRWLTTRQRYDRTHALRDQGLPMRAIGRHYTTVRRYLRAASVDPLLAGGLRASVLDSFKPYLCRWSR